MPVDARWLTAFLDLPEARFEDGARFWEAVTGSTRSEPRGDRDQFATLLPPDGDAYLRVQRHDGDEPRVHLDVHVDDVEGAIAVARDLGATPSPTHDWILQSPGGFTFCLVRHRGEHQRPAPIDPLGAGSALVDQVAIDVPSPSVDDETAFWAELLGLERRAAARPELEVLHRAPGSPLRLLVQRLGVDDARTVVDGHLDLACGEDVARLADRHRALGATVVSEGFPWTTMRDPAGLRYCLTPRDPVTGVLAH